MVIHKSLLLPIDQENSRMEPKKKIASPFVLKALIVLFGFLGLLKTTKAIISFVQGIWPADFWGWMETIAGPIYLFLAIGLYLHLKQQRDQQKL